MSTTRTLLARTACATLALALGAAACSDDPDPVAADVCAAGRELGGIFLQAPEDPAEYASFAEETVLPIVHRLEGGVPSSLDGRIEDLDGIYTGVAETGDIESLHSDEHGEAMALVGDMVHTRCGAGQVEVEAVDYGFGAPRDVDAGLTSVRFTNEGEEEHELVLMRRADGEARSLDELLELPEDEGMATMEMVGVTFASPGDTSFLSADLTPGTYSMVCFIPVGGGEEGEPHSAHGMKHTFTVA